MDDGKGVGKAPDAFRTISEVASELDVPQHVLRFWETKFSQVRPMKRAGGRRYYRPDDIALLRAIRDLLYTQGYKIAGVQKLLKDQGVRTVIEAGHELAAVESRALAEKREAQRASLLNGSPEHPETVDGADDTVRSANRARAGRVNEKRADLEDVLGKLQAIRARRSETRSRKPAPAANGSVVRQPAPKAAE